MLATGKIHDRKERQIRGTLLDLFELARLAVAQSIDYLQSGEPGQADAVRAAEQQINEMQRLLEQDCLIAIASQQPFARDLGDIIAAMRIATELERIGDHASSILNIARNISLDHLELLGTDSVHSISGTYLSMLDRVKQAFEHRDREKAAEVAGYGQALAEQLSVHMSLMSTRAKLDNGIPASVAGMLWIGQSLERCGDRLNNIASQIVFMIESEDSTLI